MQGTWWVAAVKPVILSIGAVLSAFDQDLLDLQPIGWKNYLPFIYKADEAARDKRVSTKKEEEDDTWEGPITAEEWADFEKKGNKDPCDSLYTDEYINKRKAEKEKAEKEFDKK